MSTSQTMSIQHDWAIEYPASDGEPMAETDLHRDEMMALIASLKDHFRDELDVYVAGNNFIYYLPGNARVSCSPDVYVVFGVEKKQRRVYKLWEERQPPSFIMEMSSRKTVREDKGSKKALYARLGVREYFLYDPEADVLTPPLQGFRLLESALVPEYHSIEPNEDGAVSSEVLGLLFRLEGDFSLRCIHAQTGELLKRPQEVRDAARERDVVARERDVVARERDVVARERDVAAHERDKMASERDKMASERDDALALVAAAEARSAKALREIEQLNAMMDRGDIA